MQALKCPQEDAFGFGFHLLRKIRIIDSVRRLFLGSQHKLSAVKAVDAVIQGLQITVAECKHPGEHPALIALLALALQIHLALYGHDVFDIVGLAQSFHPHIIIHAQQDVFQIGTGEAIFGNLADAAVLHIRAKYIRQHRTDLGFALAAVALNNHHALPLVGWNQAIADELLQSGDVLCIEKPLQKVLPDNRRRRIGIIGNR